MNRIFMIANEFLKKAEEHNRDVTHKQLQKLCYYVDVWSYGLWNRSVTRDKFEAWRHGPVNRNLFEYYRGQRIIKNIFHLVETLSTNEKVLISAIWEMYGNKTGDELEQMTHREKPWKVARQGLEEWEPSTVILKEKDILEFGVQLVETYKQNNLE